METTLWQISYRDYGPEPDERICFREILRLRRIIKELEERLDA